MSTKLFASACAALASLAITASSLTAAPRHPDFDKPPAKPKVNISAVAKDNNAFALDLFQQLREQEGNLFFSPYSI